MATQGGGEEEEDDDDSRLRNVREGKSGGKADVFDHSGDGKPKMVDELEDFRRQWKCEIHNQKFQGSPMRRDGLLTRGRKDDQSGSKEDPNNNDGNNSNNNNNNNLREGCPDDSRKALGDLKGDRRSQDDLLCCRKKQVKTEDSEDDGGEEDNDDEDDSEEEEEAQSRSGDEEDEEGGRERAIGGTEESEPGMEVEGMLGIASEGVVCRPEFRQAALHISDLPLEVLNLIFKWVVSSYLDVGSLESLSMVCKSFYLLARDEDLWKAICTRTWEKSCLPSCYATYRQMFLERPHVMFNGCYISRVTYFRQGEKSFDGFYRPFHMVKYYRYIRFYPEGKVYMFMSPEQPKKAVYYLRNKSSYVQGLQYGYYKLSDDKVSLVLKKILEPSIKSKRFTAKNSCHYADHEQTFFMEMLLMTTRQRRNGRLSWLKYFMHRVNKSSGESTTMTFDISSDMYPPFHFHPVKSFAAQSDLPL